MNLVDKNNLFLENIILLDQTFMITIVNKVIFPVHKDLHKIFWHEKENNNGLCGNDSVVREHYVVLCITLISEKNIFPFSFLYFFPFHLFLSLSQCP